MSLSQNFQSGGPGQDNETTHDSVEHGCPEEGGNLPDDVNDVHHEHHTLSGESQSNEEMGETESGGFEKQGTHEANDMEMEHEKQPGRRTRTNAPVRRSDRTRHPPKRLDYLEFGKPLVTAVKSVFHGLTMALADALNEEENSTYNGHLGNRYFTRFSLLPCTGMYMSLGQEGVTQV